MNEQLVKIEELLRANESRDLGQRLLKIYMDQMTLLDFKSFVIGKKYNLLIGMNPDTRGFDIYCHPLMRFEYYRKFTNSEDIMLIFTDPSSRVYFIRLDTLLSIKEVSANTFVPVG
jgi:hypothetical protein